MRFKDTISGIDGVTIGMPATIKPLIGRRHHMLDFKVTANTSVAGNAAITDAGLIIDNVEQYVGTTLVRNSTATEILKIAALNGITVPANHLPIFYSEPQRATVMDEQVTAWEMRGVNDFTIKPTFIAAIQAGTLAVASAVDTYDFEATLIGGKIARNILFHEPQTWTAGGAGLVSITNLRPGLPLNRIYFTTSANAISRVEVIADGVKVHDMTKESNDFALKQYGLDGTQFSYALCFDETGQVFNNLYPKQTLQINVYVTGACTLRGLIETLRGDYV